VHGRAGGARGWVRVSARQLAVAVPAAWQATGVAAPGRWAGKAPCWCAGSLHCDRWTACHTRTAHCTCYSLRAPYIHGGSIPVWLPRSYRMLFHDPKKTIAYDKWNINYSLRFKIFDTVDFLAHV
jgi:hypothetical protein